MNIETRAKMTVAIMAFACAVGPVRAQQPATARVPASVLERYVGEYVYPDGNVITVNLRGDTLFRETTGQRVAFVAMSQTKFRLGPVMTAEFVSDGAGGMTQIVTDGVDVEFRLPRKGSRPVSIAPPKSSVRVPKSVLEQYVGVYEFIPGQMKRTDLRIVISLRGDTLIRKMRDETVLTPISNTRFAVGNTSLTVEFVVDDAGVTQIMGSGFQQLLARRTSK